MWRPVSENEFGESQDPSRRAQEEYREDDLQSAPLVPVPKQVQADTAAHVQ